jgi:hypothetical protein
VIDIEAKLSAKLNINSSSESVTVLLKGRLDRIEEKDGCIQIIDYKTGTVNILKPGKDPENYFKKITTDSKYKESFQAFFYVWLYNRNYPDAKLNAGLFPLKNVSKGTDTLVNEFIPKEYIVLFEKRLSCLLKEIFDKTKHFEQTAEISNCKYCSFRSICNRV